MSAGKRPKVVAVIPARLDSTRFPGKPLARILGRTMLEHVYRRTRLAPALDEVLIATCDREIIRAARDFGAKAVMTSRRHKRASDRVAEAVRGISADIVVMVQGDEPMILPKMVEKAARTLIDDPKVVVANLAAPIRTLAEFQDPNTIKVVVDKNDDALYFSREPIPLPRDARFGRFPALKQVCVISFRRSFLHRFTDLKPGRLEVLESIDMLRALEHGIPVRMVPTAFATHAVDTPIDLKKVAALMRKDPLVRRYAGKAR